MKHCAFSKASWILTVTMVILLVGCSKYDEIEFTGKIIDTRECTISYLKPNLGYVVQLSSPDSIGKPYMLNGQTYNNTVILYEPDRVLYKDDRIRGSFYFDDKYSRANCTIHWNDYDLPEGVFLTLTVD